MSDSIDIVQLSELTNRLLSTDILEVEEALAEQTIKDLARVIAQHDKLYYIYSNPQLSDFQYDNLFAKLKKLEEIYPQFLDSNSPTQRITLELTKNFPSVPHLVPMLSLDNSYNAADLHNFDQRIQKLVGHKNFSYIVEPKYDGSSISLVYENDKLARGLTRGNGVVGEEITPNIRALYSIPLEVKFSDYGIQTAEVRGEVLIRKNTFFEYNQTRIKEGLAPMANPRNAASGTLRMQNSTEVKKRGLEAIMYHLSYAVDSTGNYKTTDKLKTRNHTIEVLDQLGFFTTHNDIRVCKSIDEVLEVINFWTIHRDDYPFELDGLVIKVNELEVEELVGSTSHHPRWAIAYKFEARKAETQLLNVEWQVGRVGTITPVAKLAPVEVGGVTVSSVSMFNEEFIKSKDIRIGDTVFVERAGDVIPYISEVNLLKRDPNCIPLLFPENCPSCQAKLYQEPGEAAWKCVNINCEAQLTERLIYFVSKNAMDIPGLGRAQVETFAEKGWIKTFTDIYKNIPYDELKNLQGFGEKSVNKLKEAIEESKNRPLFRLIIGLGIRYVGEATAKNIAYEINHLSDIYNFTLERLQEIPDIGEKVAKSVFDFFSNPSNRKLIEELEQLGINLESSSNSKTTDGNLSGLNFLFTGTLTQFKREDAKELVEKAGGAVANSLSSKVNFLVAGENAGSKLEKAKKMNTVKIISETEFLEMIQ
jgi:DNA ligase (NAD+)